MSRPRTHLIEPRWLTALIARMDYPILRSEHRSELARERRVARAKARAAGSAFAFTDRGEISR